MVANMTETMGTIHIMNTDMAGTQGSITGSQIDHRLYIHNLSISQKKKMLRSCPQVLLVLVSEHAWPTQLQATRLALTGVQKLAFNYLFSKLIGTLGHIAVNIDGIF